MAAIDGQPGHMAWEISPWPSHTRGNLRMRIGEKEVRLSPPSSATDGDVLTFSVANGYAMDVKVKSVKGLKDECGVKNEGGVKSEGGVKREG